MSRNISNWSTRLKLVNTARFLNQFMVGYGNYAEEREQLIGHLTVDEIVDAIQRTRSRQADA